MHTRIYDINRTNTLGKTSAERKEKKNVWRRAHSTSSDVHARRAQHHPLANAPAEMTDGQITELHKHNFLFFSFVLGFSFSLSTCFSSFEFPAAVAAAAAWKTDGKLFYFSWPNTTGRAVRGCCFFWCSLSFIFSFKKKKQQHWGEAGTCVTNGAGFKLDVVCWKLKVLQTVNWSVCVLGERGGAVKRTEKNKKKNYKKMQAPCHPSALWKPVICWGFA